MMFPVMLTDAFQDGDNGIPIRYRFNGNLFNLRRLQAKSKVQTDVVDEFFFAHDIEKGAPPSKREGAKRYGSSIWFKGQL